MSDNNKSYRIRTNVGSDSVLNVNLNQDFNVLEVLSLKIGTDNLYRFHTSDYGCIAGRVLANGNFGIPNAKISIFIAVDSADTEDDIISYLYPYKTTATRNSDKIRYNLLPEEQLSDCHRNVGTFPSKRTVLDDNHILEVYDKYYKYTTRSNESGDYMIFGVPTGAQTLHVDIDLSDIGILSQRPRDMIYKGYNITQFENGNMFKKSNDLDSLAQIISQNQSVYVYPFWGDESEGEIAITRRDIEIQYEFTSTCVFIGSLITDEASNGISKRCIPSERMGKMDRLTTGNGTIEMIRKKADGSVEEVSIQGNTLIDGNGTWCYQIPMNLDYVRTDEYGNTVPTDDPNKGIATRACVRFRFSLTEFENEGGYSHVSKVLVPHNPQYYSNAERGNNDGAVLDYVFGTNTDDASFKNLFLNNVYTVKSFIPRFQMLNIDRNKRFSGIKAVNVNNGNNPIPYNNIRVDLTFMFMLQCAIFKILLWFIGIWNWFVNSIFNYAPKIDSLFRQIKNIFGNGRCLYIGEGYCPEMEGWYFAPNCNTTKLLKATQSYIVNDGIVDNKKEGVLDEYSADAQNKESGKVCLTNQIDHFVQCVEINLAMEYDVVQFDFYNDWMNGMIYVPRWFADIRPKRSYFFGAIKTKPRVRGCMEDNSLMFSRRYVQQCAMEYKLNGSNNTDYTDIITPKGCKSDTVQKCHKSKGRKNVKIFTKDSRPNAGVVHDEQVSYGNTAYYFRPCEWLKNGKKCNLFATDLVLLGNLEKNNMQGIPQSFEKLSATSYQIPDTLASTNLGVEGFLYGQGAQAVCNGAVTTPAEQYKANKDDVKRWTNGKDFYEADPYDADEDIVTESAGIDWGFSGEDQQAYPNAISGLTHLYFPGGHFLGVSCINSETNIKSCVNLSRICEIGSIISQRQTLIGTTENGEQYIYRYTIPTGLISGEAINDYGFKNEFATLNYNGLKIRKNPETLMNEYDFEAIYPLNFNGELSGVTSAGTKYNLTGDSQYSLYTGYTRTIEESNKDYYRFRLGLPAVHTAEDSAKRFLISNYSSASLPVYENSFYFYFGLKGGNTALDRFFKDFYAQCPEMKAYEPGLTIEITKNSDFCEDNGAAKIITKNIENAKYKVEYEGLAHPISGDVSASGIVILENLPGSSPIHLEINGSNISTISRTFTVETILPGSIENLTYEVSGYTEERIEYHDERNGDGNIKFTYNAFADGNIWGVGLVDYGLTVEQKYNAKIIRNSNYTGTTAPSMDEFNVLSGITDASDLNDKLIYAWWGNRVYTIVVWYYCDNSDSIREWGKGEELIEMPEDLDIVFDDYPYATYNHMIRPLIERYPNSSEVIKKVWPNILLTSDSLYLGGTKMREFKQTLKSLPYFSGNSEVLYDTMYHVKRALFYRESQSSIGSAYGTIDFNVVGGTPPYTIKIAYGEGEKVINGTSLSTLVISGFSSSEAAADAGYSLSVNGFISPTAIFDMSTWLPVTETTTVKVDCPFDKGYFTDYAKVFSSGSTTEILPTGYTAKSPYHISIRDSRNKSISLWLPSIYRPFFMRALYFSYCQLNSSNAHKNEQKFAFAVANPLSPTVTPLMKIKHGWVSGAVTSSVTYSSQYAEYNGGINIPTGWTENYTAVSSNRAYVEKNYLTLGGYRSNSNRMITSGDYSVSMFEDGRTGATASIEKNVYVHFIGDGAGLYSPQVQYMPIDNDLANMIKRSEFGESSLPVTDNFIKPYTWTEEYGNWIPYTGFGPNKLKVSTSTSTSNAVMAPLSQFVWTPNLSVWIATNAGLIEGDNTKVYLDDNQVSKQRAAITIEDMLSENYETALSGINDHVLAIYESDDKCVYPETSAQAKEPIMMGAFYYMTENGTERHISNVTVLRLYTKEAFIKYVGETFHST